MTFEATELEIANEEVWLVFSLEIAVGASAFSASLAIEKFVMKSAIAWHSVASR